jgi:putative salt-induced outer membrane protein YdiY
MKKSVLFLLALLVAFLLSACGAGEVSVEEYEATAQTLEDNIVTVTCDVRVKNTTSETVRCRMFAVYSGTFNSNLFLNGQAVACKKDSMEEEIFVLEADSDYTLTVYFKGEFGGTETRYATPEEISLHVLTDE